jgi:hypothetical protein
MGNQVARGLEKKSEHDNLGSTIWLNREGKKGRGGPGEQVCGAQDVAEGDPG